MEEKDNKTVTMPLSEYNRMVEEIINLKMPGKDIKEKIKKYSGMSIEELEDFYLRHKQQTLKARLQQEIDYHVDTYSSYSYYKQSDYEKTYEIKELKEEIEALNENNNKLEEDLKLLRKEYDIYYNRCVELKEEINKLNQKKNRWKFWK